ncbi:hypothetical protein HPB51_025225 [Rhipicephalus microplus]|uniref:Uncharacterized protein n=1 Tax=Rhipicephalus microplus TaxID=6941 RepID=A0A9J6DDZ8_RHIMP|nr:hypothetical protein HPB51_025225 [Rhipicephalus microplus]
MVGRPYASVRSNAGIEVPYSAERSRSVLVIVVTQYTSPLVSGGTTQTNQELRYKAREFEMYQKYSFSRMARLIERLLSIATDRELAFTGWRSPVDDRCCIEETTPLLILASTWNQRRVTSVPVIASEPLNPGQSHTMAVGLSAAEKATCSVIRFALQYRSWRFFLCEALRMHRLSGLARDDDVTSSGWPWRSLVIITCGRSLLHRGNNAPSHLSVHVESTPSDVGSRDRFGAFKSTGSLIPWQWACQQQRRQHAQ